MRISALLLALLLAIPVVAAATIHGTVYNIDLNPIKNVKVEIDSPHQVFVAVNGTYSFEVSPGTYTLSAKLIKNGTTTASTTEQLQVTSEGDQVLDLILFPDLGDTSIVDESDTIDIDEVDTLTTSEFAIRAIIGVLVVCLLLWYFLRKSKPGKKAPIETDEAPSEHVAHSHEAHEKAEQHPAHTDEDVESIIKIIKEQGNRTTQKDIRKSTPLSEAKVSLIITELEHKGVIEKIKKGRANIIILKQ